ncbi:sensor histidine kinase [Acidaminobacterium chupaoyuni]
MDTKSKNWMYSKVLKTIAALLLIAIVAWGTGKVAEVFDLGINEGYRPTLTDDWQKDSAAASDIAQKMNEILALAEPQADVAKITAGETLEKDQLLGRWQELYGDKWASFFGQYQEQELKNSGKNVEYEDYRLDSADILIEKTPKGKIIASLKTEDLSQAQKEFEEKYREETQAFAQAEIDRQLKDAERQTYKREQLMKEENIKFFIQNGGTVLKNASEDAKEYESQPVALIINGRQCAIKTGDKTQTMDLSEYYGFPVEHGYYYSGSGENDIAQDAVIRIALTEQYLSPITEELSKNYEITMKYAKSLSAALLAAMVLFIYLTVVCGRKERRGEVQMQWIDAIFTEINLAVLATACVGYAYAIYGLIRYQNRQFVVPCAAVFATVIFALYYSCVRLLKNRTFLKNSLIYRVCAWVCRMIRNGTVKVYHALTADAVPKNIVWAVVIYGALCMLLAIVFPLSIALIIVTAVYAYRRAVSYQKICKGIDEIRNGNMDYKIDVQGDKVFIALADKINGLGEGLNAAVEQELKSERMKSELITNVSHDIRTPLTSIITYVDLIEKEGLGSENAPGYFEIIASKAQRLKTLTDDLFEVSKAASGTIPIEIENVDLTSLLRQGMGELDDKIQESQLDFRFKVPAERVWVRADGRQLWRVLENLFSNVFKYAMRSSRVYVEIRKEEAEVCFEMKNISAYELSGVEASELTDRFKRGDLSRQSEGSGLGLAIAKNLVELQHGTFNITVDGDLFKVTITLPRGEACQAPAEPPQEPQEN